MAFIDTATRSQLIELYVAYFNRAPDADGLAYWSDKVANGGWTVATVARSFMDQTEVKSTYPDYMTSSEIVDKVYTNVLNRAADADGKTYWVNQLNTGKVTKADLIQAVVNAAKSTTGTATDAATLTNKTSVGEYFAVTLGSNDKAAAASIMTGVTSDAATVTAAKASSTAANGQTFTLTTGAENVVGTSANDTITAVRAATAAAATDTLTAADSVDGGAGTDTMTITSTAANTDATGGSLIKNVEVINLRQAGAGVDLALNASVTTGVTAVNNYLSTGTVTVTNLAQDASFGVTGNGTLALGATTGSYVATATAGTINVTGGTGATAAGAVELLDGAAVTKVTLNADSATNTLTSLSFGVSGAGTADAVTAVVINTAGKLTTGNIAGITNDGTNNSITISGAGSASIGTLDTDVDTVNASGLTAGGVTVTLSAAAQAVTGGAGNDTVHTAALAVTKSLDAGAGTGDIISFTEDTSYATTAAKASNFEVLRAGGTGGGDSYNVSLISGITSLQAETSAGATFTNVTAAQAAAVTAIGSHTGALGVTLADATGTADSVTITLDDDAAAATAVTVAAITAAAVETLNIVSGDALASGTANVVSALTGSTAVKSTVITGTSDLTITDATAAATNVIDATNFTKILTVGAAATSGISAGDTVKGGSGADSLFVAFGTLGTTTSFIGGTGDDTLTVIGDGSDIVDGDFAAISGVDNLTVTSTTNTTVTLQGYAQSAIGTIDANSDGRLDLTATALTTGGTITGADLLTKGVDFVVKNTVAAALNGTAALTVNGGAIADTITVTQDSAADTGNDLSTTAINGGNGIDIISYTLANAAGGADVLTITSNATTLANADIITGFASGTDKFAYTGTLSNGAVTDGVANATLAGGIAAQAGYGTYIVTTNVADSGTNTSGAAFTALLGSNASTLATNFANLETQLVASGGIFNGAITGLDAAIAEGETALIALDNGTGTIILRFTNSSATGNTVTAAEIDLVGVLTNTATLAAGDFV